MFGCAVNPLRAVHPAVKMLCLLMMFTRSPYYSGPQPRFPHPEPNPNVNGPKHSESDTVLVGLGSDRFCSFRSRSSRCQDAVHTTCAGLSVLGARNCFRHPPQRSLATGCLDLDMIFVGRGSEWPHSNESNSHPKFPLSRCCAQHTRCSFF